jgi:hypothetical protein
VQRSPLVLPLLAERLGVPMVAVVQRPELAARVPTVRVVQR